jgi:hypothetical protein
MPDDPKAQETSPQEPKRESWLNNFFGKIGDQLEDLTYVSIITGTGNTYARIDPASDDIIAELEKNQITILARTNIELDGDITVIVPTKDGQGVTVNQEIMTIHKENTSIAVTNWNNFMNMIIQVIKIIAELAGMSNVAILDKLSFKATAS